jgi:pimeloyl-ACP methyl ester carboxylesterase
MGTVEYKKSDIAYYDNEGHDLPLIFLHGLCEDSSVWDDFTKVFTSNRLVKIDLPGFGNSDVIKDIEVTDVAEIVKIVLDTLKIKKCILIGHSLGGYISLAFADKYEQYLLGLSLFHSHPFEDIPTKKESRQKDIEFIQKKGHFHYIKLLIPNLFADIFASSNQFLLDTMVHRAAGFPPEGIIQAHKMMINRKDTTDVLRRLKVPVNFVIGELDKVIPIEISLRQTHIPKIADIHVMPEVAHMGMIRSKEKTQLILSNFIDFCQKLNK